MKALIVSVSCLLCQAIQADMVQADNISVLGISEMGLKDRYIRHY